MGFFHEDMKDMLEVYQVETMELMGEYDEVLLSAERQSSFTVDDINRIFRVVHTIKSSSAMMGMEGLSKLTHQIEDLFQVYREHPEVMEGHEPELFQLMYQYADYVNGETARVMEEAFEPLPAPELAGEIAHLKGGGASPEPVKEAEVPQKPQKQAEEHLADQKQQVSDGSDSMTVHVKLKENCPMKTARAYVLVNHLRNHGIKLDTVPEKFEGDGVAEHIEKQGFLLRIDVSQSEQLMKWLKKEHEVLSVDIMQNSEVTAGEPEAPKVQSAERKEVARPAAKPEQTPAASRYASVKWDRIRALQSITGELITAHSVLENEIEVLDHPRALEEFSNMHSRLLRELDEIVMSVSMLPISSAVSQLYRIVGDISRKEGKKVQLIVHGEDIEIDRTLLDEIQKPLVHIIRNAVDHGVEMPEERRRKGKPEEGRIHFSAVSDSGLVMIQITDDGKGMDPDLILRKAKEKGLLTKPEQEYTKQEILGLTLEAGFSTNEKANEISGRGVGMDVVKSVLEQIGGSLKIHSIVDEGSEITMTLPVSVTSVESIRFSVADQTMLLPIRSVARVYIMDEIQDQICVKAGREYLLREGELLPVLRMRQVYGSAESDSVQHLMIIKGIRKTMCIVIDEILGQQMAVEKPFPPLYGKAYSNHTGISGCVILGDGTIGMMLNAEKLLRIYEER